MRHGETTSGIGRGRETAVKGRHVEGASPEAGADADVAAGRQTHLLAAAVADTLMRAVTASLSAAHAGFSSISR